jgi:hypothetical protein
MLYRYVSVLSLSFVCVGAHYEDEVCYDNVTSGIIF